jgi:hypothetical protein
VLPMMPDLQDQSEDDTESRPGAQSS